MDDTKVVEMITVTIIEIRDNRLGNYLINVAILVGGDVIIYNDINLPHCKGIEDPNCNNDDAVKVIVVVLSRRVDIIQVEAVKLVPILVIVSVLVLVEKKLFGIGLLERFNYEEIKEVVKLVENFNHLI